MGGQHQGLVAHVTGGVAAGVDAQGPLQPATVAARQHVGRPAQGDEAAADREHQRRLAAAARDQVADADHPDGRPFRPCE